MDAKACATLPVRGRKTARLLLENELAATRARGCAIEEEETVAGVACVAISLSSFTEPLAGISVSVPVNRFPLARRNTLISAMRQTSLNVSGQRAHA